MNSLEKAIAAKLLWAREDGSPVAPSTLDLAAKMAAVARRRWFSYERRNPSIADTVENRIKDLAKGLATKFERGGWPMVGPLISDYTWLTEQIAPILVDDNSRSLG